MKKTIRQLTVASIIAAFAFGNAFGEVRIKDVARVKSGPDSQLIGYGLVVGLDGTGDKGKTVFTQQAITNMLQRMGVTVAPDKMKVKNVAAVIVTARITAFACRGSRLDVMVSSLGDANSLKGGTLLLTPLTGLDGQVYATAEGSIAVETAKTKGGQENYLTVGRVVNGALLLNEPRVESWINIEEGRRVIYLVLSQPDFTTAKRIAETINGQYSNSSWAIDPGLVRVLLSDFRNPVDLVSEIEGLNIRPDAVARVVINERTGTVVMGQKVVISPVAVSHGSLNIEVGSNNDSRARKKPSVVMVEGTSVDAVASALNSLGVAPRDIVDIFQAIKRAGAMQADLEIM